ncbi:predicted protein [Histoplasma capsulatum G186AR]|uniref:Uncharacterized protein n=1 Tax=Ajellomyces capsulatus (strain G186AR / H82 / ATCC MYA-2454 / RMSCC 2432) TaxID=447093 RepID=C0NPY1_AJECG|nr:uncharacterized protein HCBG_05211 [Histoplasma capsulatum G186AR]EEH06991.1 predicted protein [Histoplasma capsulatum G186AR]
MFAFSSADGNDEQRSHYGVQTTEELSSLHRRACEQYDQSKTMRKIPGKRCRKNKSNLGPAACIGAGMALTMSLNSKTVELMRTLPSSSRKFFCGPKLSGQKRETDLANNFATQLDHRAFSAISHLAQMQIGKGESLPIILRGSSSGLQRGPAEGCRGWSLSAVLGQSGFVTLHCNLSYR